MHFPTWLFLSILVISGSYRCIPILEGFGMLRRRSGPPSDLSTQLLRYDMIMIMFFYICPFQYALSISLAQGLAERHVTLVTCRLFFFCLLFTPPIDALRSSLNIYFTNVLWCSKALNPHQTLSVLPRMTGTLTHHSVATSIFQAENLHSTALDCLEC